MYDLCSQPQHKRLNKTQKETKFYTRHICIIGIKRLGKLSRRHGTNINILPKKVNTNLHEIC